ncbi:hypothetical protein OIU84_020283 [Salix udensis]|uniref:DUF4283 domain-containing protein n=1 Tax=Salix udensis TaxID=889485 RepID=A0AAD6J6X7_9ROSI|nr:hypothetical protein OIU84_020283 [Salix udensis]
MQEILERGPWLFGGKAIILQPWHPLFVFDKNRISKLPVWIRLHGLPFSLWSREGLSLVSSMVGRPLSCDEATFNCTRLDFARVCVEIDATQPFVHSFDINTPLSNTPLHIDVEFEWKPMRCAKCQLFGHSCKQPEQEMTKEDSMVLTKNGTNTGSKGKAPIISIEKNALVLIPTGNETSCTEDVHLGIKEGLLKEHKEQVNIPNPNRVDPSTSNQEPQQEKTYGCMVQLICDKGTVSKDPVNDERNSKMSKKEQASKGVVNHVTAIHNNAIETTLCSVNKVASLQSHTTEEETDSSVDSLMRATSHENRDTSPLAFTKVKKKNGGKKKGQGANR